MADKDQGKSELFGEGLPGTGGDYIDTGDVEGHKRRFDDGSEVGPEMGKTTGPYKPPMTDGDDTEGHKRRFDDGSEVGPEMGKTTGPYKPPMTDGDDTEGHLYTGGPSTQGEFAKRAPGDNPHGER